MHLPQRKVPTVVEKCLPKVLHPPMDPSQMPFPAAGTNRKTTAAKHVAACPKFAQVCFRPSCQR